MVKNLTGGTKTKGVARKHQGKGDSRLRLPDDELEMVACVTKMLGNGMCEIYTNDNNRLIGHIRNKFRGRQKRHNLITSSAIVLIGLRGWENPVKNCDILTLYDSSHVTQLQSNPSIKMDNIIKLQDSHSYIKSDDINEVEFSNKVESESDDEGVELKNNIKKTETFAMEKTSEVDIDDI